MNDVEIKERMKGAMVAVTLSVVCMIIWMLSFGGLVYLYGLFIEVGGVVLVASLVAFSTALFVGRDHKMIGSGIGLFCGISASVYLQSTSG